MIVEVKDKKDLHRFIYFVEELYRGNQHFIPPIFRAQKKELTEIVLDKNTYKALLCVDVNNSVRGRLLYTYDYSKKQGKKICYYSFYDVVNEYSVVKELFEYMEQDMRKRKIDYSEGTFSPYDPDTRRGIMIKGFNDDPAISTSYNYEYYGELLEQYGYSKAFDTVAVTVREEKDTKKRLNSFSKYFLRENDVRVDSLNWKNFEQDLKDVEEIIRLSVNEIIYQEAPSIELIREVAMQMKFFINPNYVKIARENKTDRPVGFCFIIPDFNQVFKKTKGKIRPIRMYFLRKKITRAVGKMQFVVPEYHNKGLIAHIFKTVFDEFKKDGINEFFGGTIMENNPKSINVFTKLGGEISKIYRLYGKEL